MSRLLLLLALLVAGLAPVAARALPPMACCPPAMAPTMAHGHDDAGGKDRALPGDATDCATPAATAAAVAGPPDGSAIVAAVYAGTLPAGLAGLAASAEPPPPRGRD